MIIKNINTVMFSIVIPALYYMMTNDVNEISYYLIFVLFLVITIYVFFDYFELKNISIYSIFISLLILSISGLFYIIYALDNSINRILIESTIFLVPSLFIIYMPIRMVLKISVSANILFESVNFVYSNYFRYSLSQKVIGDYIKMNKPKKAIFGLFKINIKDLHNAKIIKEIKNTILTKFENKISENAILFSYSEDTFGFFYPIKNDFNITKALKDNSNKLRKEKDAVSQLNDIFCSINKKYRTTQNQTFEVKTKSGISIYGVQSNSLETLERNSIFTINNNVYKKQNKVFVFNPKKLNQRMIDNRTLSLMDESINLNSFSNSFNPLLEINSFKNIGNYIHVENHYNYKIIGSIDSFLRNNGWKSTFDRYFSSEALNKSTNNRSLIFIQYSTLVLKDDISITDLIIKIKKIKCSLSSIVWVISYEDIINRNKYEFIKSIIKQGFKIALTNTFKFPLIDIENLAPNYIVTKIDELDKTEKSFIIPTIVPDVSNEEKLKISLEYNAEIIGGNILGSHDDFKKIDKQSKIYIEDIIKNNKKEKPWQQ